MSCLNEIWSRLKHHCYYWSHPLTRIETWWIYWLLSYQVGLWVLDLCGMGYPPRSYFVNICISEISYLKLKKERMIGFIGSRVVISSSSSLEELCRRVFFVLSLDSFTSNRSTWICRWKFKLCQVLYSFLNYFLFAVWCNLRLLLRKLLIIQLNKNWSW